MSDLPLLYAARRRKNRIAFWGHGINFQAKANSPGNRLKLLNLKHVDWWFAYTQCVADLVHDAGFPRDRITVVQNAIDTGAPSTTSEALDSGVVQQLRDRLEIGSGPERIPRSVIQHMRKCEECITTPFSFYRQQDT